MDLRELEYVVSLAKNQSVGKAAEECSISQPAMSIFISKLENNLGQPLFQRLGNKFILTYAGTRYVKTAKSMLEAKKNLEKELFDIVREGIGEIKVAFRPYGGIDILPKVLPLFWQDFPKVRIKIHEDKSAALENEILNGNIDLAFMTLPPIRHQDITYEIISKEELVMIMPKDHPLADQGICLEGYKYPWMDIAKLKDERFILQWPDQRTRQMADILFKKAEIKPNVLLTIRNINIMVELVSKGLGVAFIVETLLGFIDSSKKVTRFSVGNPATEFTFAVAFRTGIYQPNYIKHFIKLVKDAASAV
jgi:DNA-binding transcriptional LysR family regulator